MGDTYSFIIRKYIRIGISEFRCDSIFCASDVEKEGQ